MAYNSTPSQNNFKLTCFIICYDKWIFNVGIVCRTKTSVMDSCTKSSCCSILCAIFGFLWFAIIEPIMPLLFPMQWYFHAPNWHVTPTRWLAIDITWVELLPWFRIFGLDKVQGFICYYAGTNFMYFCIGFYEAINIIRTEQP